MTNEPDDSAKMDVDDNDDGDTSGSDDEPLSPKIVMPARSPLRRTFGIFCTGKGMGAFNGGGVNYGNRHERRRSRFSSSSGNLIHA